MQDEAQKIRTALRWLESHNKRLAIEKKSLEEKLAGVTRELDRLAAEIAAAEERLRKLTTR